MGGAGVGGPGGGFGEAPAGGVDGGEAGVGVGDVGVDFGDEEAVGEADGLGVDLSAADDEDFVGVGAAEGYGVGEGGGCLDAGSCPAGVAGDDDVAPAGEGAGGEGFKCAPAHDYGVAEGELLEAAEVG